MTIDLQGALKSINKKNTNSPFYKLRSFNHYINNYYTLSKSNITIIKKINEKKSILINWFYFNSKQVQFCRKILEKAGIKSQRPVWKKEIYRRVSCCIPGFNCYAKVSPAIFLDQKKRHFGNWEKNIGLIDRKKLICW